MIWIGANLLIFGAILLIFGAILLIFEATFWIGAILLTFGARFWIGAILLTFGATFWIGANLLNFGAMFLNWCQLINIWGHVLLIICNLPTFVFRAAQKEGRRLNQKTSLAESARVAEVAEKEHLHAVPGPSGRQMGHKRAKDGLPDVECWGDD